MILYQLTLAGANQFTGADVNTGLVDPQAYMDLHPEPIAGRNDANVAPVLLGYSYFQAAAAPANFTITVEIFDGAGGAPATAIVRLHETTARASLFRACSPPGLVIPTIPGNVHQIRCITTNKANDGTFQCWLGFTRVP